MGKSISIVMLALLSVCADVNGQPGRPISPPSYSQQAIAIWDNIWVNGEPTGTVQIPSPDGDKKVTATYDQKSDRLWLTIGVGPAQFRISVAGGVGSELAWSPDSRAFFLTYSEAGLDGDYHTCIIYVSSKGIRRLSVDRITRRAFGNPVKCLEPSSIVNVVGVAWLEDSKRILVAAQIVPLNICDSFNTFKAFEIYLPERIVVKPYEQLTAKKKFWNYLGTFLREAPDNCITDPKSCEMPENHRRVG